MEPSKSTDAAQAVIEQARSEADQRKNARTARVSLLYRFDELKPLQPWQQHAVLQQAATLANREPSVIAVCGMWLTVFVALAFASPDWFHGPALWATVSFLVLTFLLFQRARVRHHVRQLMRANSPAPQA